jgi:hypothetical protein
MATQGDVSLALPPQDADDLQYTKKCLDPAEEYAKGFRRRANHWYALYRSYQDVRRDYNAADSRGRDEIWNDLAAGDWGSNLIIPVAFSTIETIVPMMLAERPMPEPESRNPDAEDNVGNLKWILDAQQEQIGYELVLQELAKTGLIYSIAWQKVTWKQDYRRRRRLVPTEAPLSENPSGYAVESALELVYDDPWAESIDPFDLLHDPYGSSVEELDYIFHRTWRSMRYIAKRVESGAWRLPEGIELADIETIGDEKVYGEVWNRRMDAQGWGKVTSPDKRLHEVLEFHDGEKVITVLDRKLVVASGENPYWHGQKPFQAYRPTKLPNQLYGISEIEAIEQLAEELSTLRRQRRDNAALILQRVFAYADGMVDPDDIEWGPGMMFPVQGDPRELLFPIDVRDIPYSGYQEEDRLKEDVQRTSGISDPTSGLSTGDQTATGVQLVQSAAAGRVKNKTLRLELEAMVPGGQQMIELDQQMIRTARDVQIPTEPGPDEPDRRYEWAKVGPEELAGEFAYRIKPLSSMPDNVPQEREDARNAFTMLAENENVDQRKLTTYIMAKNGIQNPEGFLAPPKPEIPPETLDILEQQFGVSHDLIAAALEQGLSGEPAQVPPAGGNDGPPPSNGAVPPPGPDQKVPGGA